jgi:hypothetical protein
MSAVAGVSTLAEYRIRSRIRLVVCMFLHTVLFGHWLAMSVPYNTEIRSILSTLSLCPVLYMGLLVYSYLLRLLRAFPTSFIVIRWKISAKNC